MYYLGDFGTLCAPQVRCALRSAQITKVINGLPFLLYYRPYLVTYTLANTKNRKKIFIGRHKIF